MEKLVETLKNYKTIGAQFPPVPALVRSIETVGDLAVYTSSRLSEDQQQGRRPIISVLDRPEGLTPVRLDLYWNPQTEELIFDWDDSHPYETPHRCVP